LVSTSSSISNVFTQSKNNFSVHSGEGLGDDCSGGLLFLAFNGGEGFLSLVAFGNLTKVVSPGLVVVSFPDCIPLIGNRCMEGDGRGWSWWGGRASTFRVGVGRFVGMGVGWLWVQLTNFSSMLCNLFLKLGDLVGAAVLGGSKCGLHTVKAGENLLHDVIVGLSEHCRLAEHSGAESVLGKSSVGAFAWSRGASWQYGLLSVLLGRRGAFAGKEFCLRGGRGRTRGGSRCRVSKAHIGKGTLGQDKMIELIR
jgi:hypothetical protein